jgi:glutamate--cysteine ligase
MDRMMSKTSSMGQWMMRNTTSIQVSIDLMDEQDAKEMLFISDCLHPISAYLFSNSPFTKKLCNGYENQRNIIWKNTDNRRSNNLIDHDIFKLNNIVDDYIKFILETPTIYSFDKNNKMIDSSETIYEQLQAKLDEGKLNNNHIHELMRQIFTNVRLKNTIEIRGADRLPIGAELAPAAFWIGLLYSKKNRKVLINTLNNWTTEERYKMNDCTLSLEDQNGPLGKPFLFWVDWTCKLALSGLDERGLNEKIYFENYCNDISLNNPLSIQEQSLFNESDISINNFILDRFS